MRAILLLIAILLSACSSAPRDRTEMQAEYEREEAKNQEKSLQRSDLMTKVQALTAQISAIDGQIENQRELIASWKQQSGVASSKAMVDSAKVRIRHLKEERAALVTQREYVQKELDAL